MEMPMWAVVIALWLLSLGGAAAWGAAWEWTAGVFVVALVVWLCMWASAKVLHGFLVPTDRSNQ